MKQFIVLILLASWAVALPVLITPKEATTFIDKKDTVFVHISSKDAYDLAHIKGAVHTTIDAWRMPKAKHLVVKPKDAIQKHMQDLGINNNSHVILYANINNPKDFLKSTYIFWAMKYYGLKNVSLIDGGFNAYEAQNLPTVQETTTVQKGNFKAKVNHDIFANMRYVAKHTGKLPMIDARPANFYLGFDASPGVERKGHIKGAMHYFWRYSVNDDYTLKSQKELQYMIKNYLNIDKNQEMIVYCTGGLETSMNFFVLSAFLEYKKVRLYDASMKEWGNTPKKVMQSFVFEHFNDK